ncbi:MAG: OmpA family protein [Burkholderiaceae bacterium]|nr:OmpA family protein [Burkholderiaceae bacterium]
MTSMHTPTTTTRRGTTSVSPAGRARDAFGRHARTAVVIGAALLAAACATPRSDPALLQAREAVERTAQDPMVMRHAAAEAARAQEALRLAEAAALEERGRDEIAHRAYVAQQLANVASAQASARAAEARVQQASAERERIRLMAREREAMNAQLQAARAREQAEQAQRMAQQQQQQTAAAREQAQSAAQQAEQARLAASTERERADQLQRQLQEFSAKQTSRGAVVTLGGDVLFDTDKAQLRTGARRSVKRLAEVLQQHPDKRVTIEGFTDSQGSDDYNMELSRRRAEAVRDALAAEGVQPQAMEVRPHGEAYPVADNDTAAGRQMNRRVEIVIGDGTDSAQSR